MRQAPLRAAQFEIFRFLCVRLRFRPAHHRSDTLKEQDVFGPAPLANGAGADILDHARRGPKIAQGGKHEHALRMLGGKIPAAVRRAGLKQERGALR